MASQPNPVHVAWDATRQGASSRSLILGSAALLALVVIVGYLFLFGPLHTFQAEYGGDPAIYEEIATTKDCARLEQIFGVSADTANQTSIDDPDQRHAVGYARAADKRMVELNCYGSPLPEGDHPVHRADLRLVATPTSAG